MEFTVKQARMLKDISIRKMAKLMGMSTNTYLNKEKGSSRFYFDEAIEFSNIVEIPVENIFFGSNVAQKCDK